MGFRCLTFSRQANSNISPGSDKAPRTSGRPVGRLAVCAAAALLLATLAAQAKATIESTWTREAVTVDGSAEDWQGSVTYVEGRELYVGARNDAEYLYLCVYSEDPQTGQQAIGRGLSLQLVPKGGAPLTIGFPIGFLADGGPQRGMERPDREQMRKRAEESLDSFTLREPGAEYEQRVAVDNRFGIELRAGFDEGRFVYEARIPLAVSELHPFAIGVESGGLVSVTLEPPKMDRDSMGPAGGGMRPGGLGGGGMPRGAGLGERPDPAGPIKLKAKIRLAASPGEEAAGL